MRYRLIPTRGESFQSHFMVAYDLNTVRLAAQAMMDDLGVPIQVVEHEEGALVKTVMTVGGSARKVRR